MTTYNNGICDTPILDGSAMPNDKVSTTYDLGIYAVETTQRHAFGRRYITSDGRVFKYGHAVAAVRSGYGAFNACPQNILAVLPAAVALGIKTLGITIAATDGYAADGVVAKDELVGAYVVLNNNTENPCNRRITGNTAVAANGGTCTITMDGPVANAALTTSSYAEVLLNPYKYLSGSSYDYNSVLCVPAVYAAATYNFWGQTWGPCWVTPGGGDATPGNTAGDRSMYFVGDGSVNGAYSLAIETGYQYAGFIIDQTSAALSACPFLMLQLGI